MYISWVTLERIFRSSILEIQKYKEAISSRLQLQIDAMELYSAYVIGRGLDSIIKDFLVV